MPSARTLGCLVMVVPDIAITLIVGAIAWRFGPSAGCASFVVGTFVAVFLYAAYRNLTDTKAPRQELSPEEEFRATLGRYDKEDE